MRELNTYLERLNSWNQLFGCRPFCLSNAEDRQAIADSIDSALSPENLTCDGELSPRAVQARRAQLTRAAVQLRQLDPSVKFIELA